MNYVTEYLDDKGIEYTLYTHPPVFTVEAAQEHCSHIPGMHCKNLFFRDPKGRNHILVIIPNTKPVDIKLLGQKTGFGRLSFASKERMNKYLGLEPGSVSVFGLINDKNAEVHLYLDKELADTKEITFHPNDNSATLVLTQEMFEKYLSTIENGVHYIDI